MKLHRALIQLEEKDSLLGIYDELIAHLSKTADGEFQIPVHGSSNEFVDQGYIDEVLEQLTSAKDLLIEERRQILEWEVSDAEDRGDRGTGE